MTLSSRLISCCKFLFDGSTSRLFEYSSVQKSLFAHAHILPILFLTSAIVTSPAAWPCGNSSVDRPVVTGSNHGSSSSGNQPVDVGHDEVLQNDRRLHDFGDRDRLCGIGAVMEVDAPLGDCR